jgi:hypothetical protein
MRKLTGKMLHEAFIQSDDEIIGIKYKDLGLARPQAKAFEKTFPFTQEAYNRMAEILNEQQQSEVTLWDACEVAG